MAVQLNYTTVATAIGEVAIWWSGIETMAHGLAVRLAVLNEPSLEVPNATNQLNLILTNMGQRDLFAAIKALAFHGSPDDLFPRLEPILNELDNSIRTERNRFMHDSWFASGQSAERTSRSAKIINAQAGRKELRLYQTVPYSSFEELDALAKKMKGRYAELEAIAEEISARITARQAQREEPPR